MKDDSISYTERCSLIVISGEKLSLHLLIEMIQYALKLLNCASASIATSEYNSLKDKPLYAKYIEESILNLSW